MRSNKDQVIVLKSVNYSESDKVITVFGKDGGKYALFAKGVRKIESKNRGHIQTLTVADISYYEGNGLPILLEGNSVYIPEYSNDDIKNIERVLVIVNKLMPDGQSDEELYSALKRVLTSDFDINYVNRFRLYFLINEGVLGDISICSVCESEKSKYINRDLEAFCSNCIKTQNDSIIEVTKTIYSDRKFTSFLDRYIDKMLSN